MKEIKTGRSEKSLNACISGNFDSKILEIPPLSKNLREQTGIKFAEF